MPSTRRHPATKFTPWLRAGHLADDDLAPDVSTPAPGSITPEHLDRGYIESTFGAAASGALRQIKRMWVADGQLFSEATDEF